MEREGNPIGVNPNLIRVLYSGGLKNLVITSNGRLLNESPLPLDELLKLASRRDANGIAVAIGGDVAVLTISDVEKVKLTLPGLWNWIKDWCSKPGSLCILGEPRCPRDGETDGVVCYMNVIGEWRCRHYAESARLKHPDKPEFNPNAGNRILHVVLCLPGNVDVPEVDKGIVKLRRSGHQVIAGPHRSGVPYELARLVNGELRSIGPVGTVNEPVTCIRLNPTDANQLAAALGVQVKARLEAKPVNEPQVKQVKLEADSWFSDVVLGGAGLELIKPQSPEYLINLVEQLYALGFTSVVLVNERKEPIAEHRHWKEPISREEAIRLLRKYLSDPEARGKIAVAIYPRHYQGQEHVRLLVFDIDDVKRADPWLTECFGNWRVTLCGQPDSLCGFSGPRCPYDGAKKDIECKPDGTGDYTCIHKGADHPEFKLSKAPRGMYIVVRVPEEAAPPGTIRSGLGGAVEVMVDNYQVIAGAHRSGAQYTPATYVNGKPTPLVSLHAPGVLLSDAVRIKACLERLSAGAEAEAKPEPQVEAEAEPEVEPGATGTVIKLNEDQINRLIEHVIDYYKPGNRDIVLFSVLSFLVTHNVDFESAMAFVDKLTRLTNDEEAKQRIAVAKWIYKKATERPPNTPPKAWNKNKIIENMANVIMGSDGVSQDKALEMAKEWLKELYKITGVGVKKLKRIGKLNHRGNWFAVLHEPEVRKWLLGQFEKGKRRGKIVKLYEVYEGDIEFYVVRDPLFGYSKLYVVKTGDDNVFYASGENAIEEVASKLFKGTEWSGTDYSYVLAWVKFMFRRARRLRGVQVGHIIGGFYPDGFSDGLVKPYPVKRHGCNPESLKRLIEWVKEHYPPSNVKFALANIGLALGKLVSPAVRFERGIFDDRVVINVGQMWLGKSTLFRSIINLFGLDRDDRSIYVTSDVSVKTPERIRNLLMETNAPAFIDEVVEEGLEALRELLLASATTGAVIGLQANRMGYGFATEFRSMRSVMINTNMTVGEIKRVLSQGGRNQGAWVRRVIILQWNPDTISPDVKEWEGEPIIDCIIELWNDPQVRNELIRNSRDIIDLSIKLVKKFGERYNVDVSEIIEALQHVKELVKELEEEVIKRHSYEELVIARAYEITRQVIGASNITPYHIVKAMAENPTMFDIRITSGKDSSADEDELRELAKELGVQINDPSNYAPGTSGFNLLSDVEKAYVYVWKLMIRDGKNRVIIYANSQNGLLQGSPTVLFGSQRGVYNGRRGFSVSWVTLLRYLFNLEEKNKGEHGENGKP